jgi:hypothetical protein
VTGRRITLAAAVCLGLTANLAAQESLGNVANQEAARRKQAPSGKSYSNDNLKPEPQPSSPPVAPTGANSAASSADGESVKATTGAEAAAEEGSGAPKARNKRDETYWRNMAKQIHGRVQQYRDLVQSTEQRLAALDEQIENGAGASVVQERKVTADALAKHRKGLEAMLVESKRLWQKAQFDHVPAEWIQ